MAKRSSSDCSSGGFYKSPTANQTVSTSNPVNVAWDNSCLDPAPKLVDIYLYAPGHNASLIQAFNGADYAHGSMDMSLDPAWWGNNATINLQLAIVSHGTPSFMTSIPAGPIFVATYNSADPHARPKSSNTGKGGIIQDAKNIFDRSPGGSIAAAVIIPLLAVAVAIFFYIRHQRTKRVDKSKRFSQVIDQRMSTISSDWRSISGAGANAAIRASMAVDASAYGRPASFISTTESGQAGVGARFNNIETTEQDVPRMSQLRASRISATGTGERSSRVVSFASDPRPSFESANSRPTVGVGNRVHARSFHQAQNFDDDEDDGIDGALQISPRQSLGPPAISNAEIEARASTGNESLRLEMLQMPAMTLMRTGKHATGPSTDLILPAPILRQSSSTVGSGPAVPSPTLQVTSPIPPRMATMSPPLNPTLSPDDLLRAYAAGRAPPVYPGTVLGGGAQSVSGGTANTGMRILYGPPEEVVVSRQMSPSPALAPTQVDNNPFRRSMAARSVYTASMYSGNIDVEVEGDNEDAYAGYGTAQ